MLPLLISFTMLPLLISFTTAILIPATMISFLGSHSLPPHTSTFQCFLSKVAFKMKVRSCYNSAQNLSMTPRFLLNGIQIPSPSGQSQAIPQAHPALSPLPSLISYLFLCCREGLLTVPIQCCLIPRPYCTSISDNPIHPSEVPWPAGCLP